jgi:hypothetical protein
LPNSSLRRAARLAGVVPFAAIVLFVPSAIASSSGGASPTGTAAPTPSKTTPSKTATSKKPSSANTTSGSGQLGSRVLRRGMQGNDVSLLQGDLTLAGFETAVDGQFGPQTQGSVVSFQRAHGISASGVVNAAVVKTLLSAVKALEAGGAVQKAHINPDGTATAPASAPPAVKAVIAAANQIIDTYYCYAGGHASWNSPCYDCSGAVSYALHGGGLLSAPLAVQFEGYGLAGAGRWITVYADSEHVFAAIAGLAFDTADFGGPNIPEGDGPRWRYDPTGNLADGGDYVERHPAGL